MTSNIFCPSNGEETQTCDVIFEELSVVANIVESHLTVNITAGAGGAVTFPNHFILTMLAGETITKGDVLRASSISGEVKVADSSDVSNHNSIVGIATEDSTLSSPVNMVSAGICQCATWAWSPGPVYFDSTGSLTQTPPVAPDFLLIVAKAIDATIILVDIEEPILLD